MGRFQSFQAFKTFQSFKNSWRDRLKTFASNRIAMGILGTSSTVGSLTGSIR